MTQCDGEQTDECPARGPGPPPEPERPAAEHTPRRGERTVSDPDLHAAEPHTPEEMGPLKADVGTVSDPDS